MLKRFFNWLLSDQLESLQGRVDSLEKDVKILKRGYPKIPPFVARKDPSGSYIDSDRMDEIMVNSK